MGTVLPGLVDRWRTMADGRTKYTGKIAMLDAGKWTVIAVVYGWSLDEMRARKRTVYKALKDLHNPPRAPREAPRD